MNKKRILLISVIAMIIGAILAGTTYAYIIVRSHSVVNTFVAGDIEITLTETTGSKYTLVPGNYIEKDPKITVKEGSVECWLFVKAESNSILDTVARYSIADGWTALSGVPNVYWQRVEESLYDKDFHILKNDMIVINDTATEEKLASLGNDIDLTFTAYAVQSDGISTPDKAWEIISTEEAGA